MARVIEHSLTVVAADIDGYTVENTDITGPFPIALPLDGALSQVNPATGVREVDMGTSKQTQNFGVLVGFTTGLTGSVADVTIVGRDLNGNALTEVVTMPGASSTVSSVNVFSYIESMMIDAAYTNLSVGVLVANAQLGPWVILDHYQNPFELMLDLVEVTDGSTARIDITTDDKFLRAGDPEPDSSFIADAPFDSVTATQNERLLQKPEVAVRLRHVTGSAGAWRARFMQAGGGFR
jgi:hypothetical protein